MLLIKTKWKHLLPKKRFHSTPSSFSGTFCKEAEDCLSLENKSRASWAARVSRVSGPAPPPSTEEKSPQRRTLCQNRIGPAPHLQAGRCSVKIICLEIVFVPVLAGMRARCGPVCPHAAVWHRRALIALTDEGLSRNWIAMLCATLYDEGDDAGSLWFRWHFSQRLIPKRLGNFGLLIMFGCDVHFGLLARYFWLRFNTCKVIFRTQINSSDLGGIQVQTISEANPGAV